MSIINASPLLGAGADGYQIERSLRFSSASSKYLNRTPASAGNRKTYTISMWIKRAKLGASSRLFGAYSSASAYFEAFFTSSDTLQWYYWNGSGYSYNRITSQVFRDPSAWCHFVFVFNSPSATGSQRIRIYFNGQEITTFSSSTDPSQNFDCVWNSTANNVIGDLLYGGSPGSTFDGLITEVHHIDGQALTPSSFGETDTITGVWKPKRYSGTYGTNGFYLKFADNSGTTSTTLGKDSSGNGNNWTPNNFSVTAGAGNDSLIDTPTPYADGGNGRGNYATWNPLKKNSGVSFSNGNLDFSGPATAYPVFGNIAMTTGKWYWENLVNSNDAGDYPQFGVVDLSADENNSANLGSFRAIAYRRSGFIRKEGTDILSGRPTFTNGDVISVAFDASTGKVWFAKNGTWVNGASGSAGDPAAGTNEVGTVSTAIQGYVAGGGGYSSATFSVNFGQRPFAYTPPSGFLALNTQNLPEPSIKKPSSYFDTKLYTGNNGTLTVTGLGFSPDLVWIKNREVAGTGNVIQDTVRGATAYLQSNSTSAENTNTANNWFRAFTSDGFTVAATTSGGTATSEWNNNGSGYAAWCWDKSATPGFDIVTYTGNGGTQNISHTLGVVPRMIIIKDRSAVANWYVYHTSLGTSQALLLSSTSAAFAPSPAGVSAISSSNFTLGGARGETNTNAENYVAYLWSEVAGFSKFGSYTGNGSSDGPFVACNFRPRWVMTKRTDTTSNWMIMDAGRNPSNVADNQLYPNLSFAEAGASSSMDLTSNGFKLRNTGSDFNAATATYIFAAFAESPFKYSLAR